MAALLTLGMGVVLAAMPADAARGKPLTDKMLIRAGFLAAFGGEYTGKYKVDGIKQVNIESDAESTLGGFLRFDFPLGRYVTLGFAFQGYSASDVPASTPTETDRWTQPSSRELPRDPVKK